MKNVKKPQNIPAEKKSQFYKISKVNGTENKREDFNKSETSNDESESLNSSNEQGNEKNKFIIENQNSFKLQKDSTTSINQSNNSVYQQNMKLSLQLNKINDKIVQDK